MSIGLPVLRRAVVDRRVASAWWTLAVIVYCGLIVAVWPVIDGNEEFQQVYEEMPEALQAMFGGDGFSDFTSPTGFLNTYLYTMILPFVFAGLAIGLGTTLLAREEDDGVLELLLSYPVARRRVIAEKASALVATVVGVGAVTVVVLGLAREPVSLDVGVAGLLSATTGTVLFAVVHGLVALAIGAWTGAPGAATGAAWGVALVGYLVNVMAELAESLEPLAAVSPIAWATEGSPIAGEWPTTYLLLLAVAASLVVASAALFERHDVT